MSDLADKLFQVAARLDDVVKQANAAEVSDPLQRLRDAANQVGRAWSGSCLGYHSRVYYANLEPPPPGAHFSLEWGADNAFGTGSRGDWCEYTFDGVRDTIFQMAKVESLKEAEAFADRAKKIFEQCQEEFLSSMTVALQQSKDPFLTRLEEQGRGLELTSKFDYARAASARGKFFTRDTIAAGQGMQTPPHLAVIAECCAIHNVGESCDKLANIARRAASHIQMRGRHEHEKRAIGTNVFIGHGRSAAWRDVKDFLQDRLGLPWDEFNRVPVAGITNITRLSQMLDEAAIAFLVLTAEDEQADGTMHARMNVIHEAGLFQGRLGFAKAIVLLEDGCDQFSNIEGLGQIRFPKGNIKAIFEEIRRVLEREGLIESYNQCTPIALPCEECEARIPQR